jgi:hypothetical protein
VEGVAPLLSPTTPISCIRSHFGFKFNVARVPAQPPIMRCFPCQYPYPEPWAWHAIASLTALMWWQRGRIGDIYTTPDNDDALLNDRKTTTGNQRNFPSSYDVVWQHTFSIAP